MSAYVKLHTVINFDEEEWHNNEGEGREDVDNNNIILFEEKYREKMCLKDKIEVTINEFEKFIEFIKCEKPGLSAKKGVFGKKDSFKLNQILGYKKNVNKPNYTQDQYPVIDLMFLLALAGRFYIKANDEKGKAVLVKTPALESYQRLNLHEKYVYLLQTYWTKYDFDANFGRWEPASSLRSLLTLIANADAKQRIIKDDYNPTRFFYSEGAPIFHQLRFFGFGELELIDGVKFRYEDSIRAFIPSEFGIYLSGFLLEEAFITMNSKSINFLLTDHGKKIKPEKDKNPFKIFINMFPKEVKRTVVTEKEDRTGVYTFKVSLSKKLWRKISVSHKHSLSDLHMAIQETFDFDNDHLYAFYVGGSRRTGKAIYCAYAESEGSTAEETTIADLGLFKGQKLLYLFDFGDEWKFDIQLLSIDKNSVPPIKPIIVETKGESPEQYYDW